MRSTKLWGKKKKKVLFKIDGRSIGHKQQMLYNNNHLITGQGLLIDSVQTNKKKKKLLKHGRGNGSHMTNFIRTVTPVFPELQSQMPVNASVDPPPLAPPAPMPAASQVFRKELTTEFAVKIT